MIWKKSTSLLTVPGKEVLVYNTLNGITIGCSQEHVEQLNDIFAYPDKYIETPAFNKLVETQFLLEECDDVHKITEQKFNHRYITNAYLGLTIMPTEQCNFRCIYCYEDHIKPKMTLTVQQAIIDFVEENIANHKGLWVEWFGGEPLLALDVIQFLSEHFIDICKRHKKPYKAGMTTNGYLLDHAMFSSLYNLNVWHYQITLDGPKQIHDKQRPLANGAGSFEHIIENLKEIRDEDKHRLWGITLRTNVSLNMLDGMKEYLDMLKRDFFNDRRFTFTLRKMWSNNTDKSDKIVCADDVYNGIVQNSLKDGFISFNDYQMSFNLGYVCYASKPSNFVIGSDGKFYKCTVHFDDDNNYVGYISEDGSVSFFSEKLVIWNAPSLKMAEKCSDCSLYATCSARSCPAKGENINCESLKDDIVQSISTFKKLGKYINLEEYI